VKMLRTPAIEAQDKHCKLKLNPFSQPWAFLSQI